VQPIQLNKSCPVKAASQSPRHLYGIHALWRRVLLLRERYDDWWKYSLHDCQVGCAVSLGAPLGNISMQMENLSPDLSLPLITPSALLRASPTAAFSLLVSGSPTAAWHIIIRARVKRLLIIPAITSPKAAIISVLFSRQRK